MRLFQLGGLATQFQTMAAQIVDFLFDRRWERRAVCDYLVVQCFPLDVQYFWWAPCSRWSVPKKGFCIMLQPAAVIVRLNTLCSGKEPGRISQNVLISSMPVTQFLMTCPEAHFSGQTHLVGP